MIELYEAAGWKRTRFLPHAGHLFAAHCVAGLGLGMAEAAPDPGFAYGGYWDGVRVADGRVTIPDAPGAGYEAQGESLRIAGGPMTAKLRHIAISVPELKPAAEFYKKTFGLEEVNYVETPYGDGLSLSDGVINLTLLKFHSDDAAGDERGKDFHGIHHMGFIVDDLEKYSRRVRRTAAASIAS